MKKPILIFLFYSISVTNAFSQEFAPIGTQWYYGVWNTFHPHAEYLHLKSVADTLIDGRLCRKITRTLYKFTGEEDKLPDIYLFQDANTVFMYSLERLRFIKLLIFNASTGDTLNLDVPYDVSSGSQDSTYRVVIESVSVENFNGTELKKYLTNPLDGFNFGSGYIDQIGGMESFFPTPIGEVPGGPPFIRCYSDAQININFQELDCDHRVISSIEEYGSENNLKVYPNPAKNIVNFYSLLPIKKIELYNIEGQLLFSSRELKIDISRFLPGILVVVIHFENGEQFQGKIMKK